MPLLSAQYPGVVPYADADPAHSNHYRAGAITFQPSSQPLTLDELSNCGPLRPCSIALAAWRTRSP